MHLKLIRLMVLGAIGVFGFFTAVQAAEFPDRPITIIVPYANGGQGDIIARAIADNLPARIGQPVIVVNRPGANGVIGTQAVAQARPDGYTIGVVVASHAVSPAFNATLPFDSVHDFVPITTAALTEMVVVGSPTMEPRNLKEFIALAKSKPGELVYKSAGPGSNSHLFSEWLQDATGIRLIHAPYKGSGDSSRDLVAGVIHLGFDTLPGVKGYIVNKQMKLLAVGGPKRSPTFPDVPTVAEYAGIPDFQANTWSMVLAPKGTPDEVVNRLNRDIIAVFQMPAVRQRLENTGAQIVGNTPAQAREMLAAQVKFYGDLVKRLGLKVTN
ncbi:tripartite tricarboxylate transporter substrate binding protein [Hydrogenophaga sp. 2FB]|uniref:Bug family tripartite tricarboxylate transporter substrate binding protein n=1 Tax=Hydrogenophaga sp. 2FB TaxID=2502187 RepID=UPI0010F70C18|nr:tripartite tricarboxylate transporter substrate binding protein [Hydrogenophaga sp. 2FB]